MSIIEKISSDSKEYDAVLAAPKEKFDSPMAVVECEQLDFQQKEAVLKVWKNDEEELQIATAENMEGGEESRVSEVADALIELSRRRS